MIEKLGVNEIFEDSYTNFVPLVGNNPFYINKVFQTNLLNVNEVGTKLVSITTIIGIIEYTPINNSKTIYMKVDRPFLFIIRNEKFNVGKDIILIAKIEDIEKQ